MLVDSSGSRKPPARPTATQLRFHGMRRAPGQEADGSRRRQRLGHPGCDSRMAVASSSLRWWLEYTWPLPMRCCSGMRHCQPAARARWSVSSAAALALTRKARRSLDRRAANGSSPRTRCAGPARSAARASPEQSMNRSPATRSPLSSTTSAMKPSGSRERGRDDLALGAYAHRAPRCSGADSRIEAGVEMEGVRKSASGESFMSGRLRMNFA